MVTSFTVLNLFIGVIVDAMQKEHEAEAQADRADLHNEVSTILTELRDRAGRTCRTQGDKSLIKSGMLDSP